MTDLIDSFMEHHPVSPVGTTIKPEQLKAVQEEMTRLRAQLAKANERIAGLELNVKASKEFIAIARVMFLDLDELEVNSTEYADLLSDLFTLFCGGDEFQRYIDQFAVDKKIEAVNWFSEKYCDDEHWFLADKAIEQLRKEQE